MLPSKRLRELEALGVVRADPTGEPGVYDYPLTAAGEDLRPLLMGLGIWGHRWLEGTIALQRLDPTLLMWDMHRGIKASLSPAGCSTAQFSYPEMEELHRDYWLVVADGEVEVCWVDPGDDIDLWLRCPHKVMRSIWVGYTSLQAEIASGVLEIDGDSALARTMPAWLRFPQFAKTGRRPAD